MKYVIWEEDDYNHTMANGIIVADGETKKQTLLNFAKKMVLDDNNFVIETEKQFEDTRKKWREK